MVYRPNVRSDAPTHIWIDLATKELSFYHRNKLRKVYPIAVGKHNTPTPTGSYSIVNKTVNPGGVFGTRWMGLNIPAGNYGIHGTNDNSSIGKNISLGCIRMYNRDVEEIYPLTPLSTPVKILAGQSTKLYHSTENNYSGFFYTVKAGDTLWSIAKTYKVPMKVIAKANNLSNPNTLFPGQKLIIPQ